MQLRSQLCILRPENCMCLSLVFIYSATHGFVSVRAVDCYSGTLSFEQSFAAGGGA